MKQVTDIALFLSLFQLLEINKKSMKRYLEPWNKHEISPCLYVAGKYPRVILFFFFSMMQGKGQEVCCTSEG